MRWLKDIFRKKEAALSTLSQTIIEYSDICAGALADHFKQVDESASKNYESKCDDVWLELLYFWLHHTNRIVYGELGPEKGKAFQDASGPMIMGRAVETICGNESSEFKRGVLEKIYSGLN